MTADTVRRPAASSRLACALLALLLASGLGSCHFHRHGHCRDGAEVVFFATLLALELGSCR